ncbi:MAG: 3'-5' exonuclease [Campylobacterota bacterium]|nr:3'-5' exonuclease [Campylobacterota bacterium]
MSFIVLDTEGKGRLTQIAIVDESGELILEHFIDGNLSEVLLEAKSILESHLIVAHYAEHDISLLKRSYDSIGVDIDLKSSCTYLQSKQLLPDHESHTLDFLSQSLFLQYEDKFFDKDLAHRASYDARYTYQLYMKLLDIESSLKRAKVVNPFLSSKVDNPFQEHFDDMDLYKAEFATLLNSVKEIKEDPNHQTKSAIVLADAGNGKTHLMMRFVKSVSKTNRFLFIGKPNDTQNILLHIYTKILESFIQKIDDSPYSQLEYLLAKSFAGIIIQNSPSKKIKEVLEDNPLNIYTHFGKDGTQYRVKNWKSIERVMLKWYRTSYGSDLVSIGLLKALIKYTFYVDENRRDIVINYLSAKELSGEQLGQIGLDGHGEDFNKEVFALAAISLFGKLSIFDEPLIISFDQLEAMSGDDELIEKFAENLKELITQTPNSLVILNLFPSRWREYEAMFDGSIIDLLGRTRVYLERPCSVDMRKMLMQRAEASGVNLEYIFTSAHLYKDILQYDSIRKVLNRAYDYYQSIVHQIPLPKVSELSLEEKLKQLVARVEYLESLHKIEQPQPQKKMNFDIKRYIDKVYDSKNIAYSQRVIIDDKNDIDRLKFILKSIDSIYDISLDFFKMKKVIPEHVIIKTEKYAYVIGFLHLEGRTFVHRIKNFNQLVINNSKYQFRLFRDSRERSIGGKVSNDEILKLKNAPNGNFLMMDQEDRVIYETIYQLITDLKNKDIEIPLEELMSGICLMFKDFWLCKLIDTL